MGQHQVKREADDDGGQTKEGIREQDQEPATGEPADRQCRPARQSDEGGKGCGRNTNRQRKSDDAREFGRPERGPEISQRNNSNRDR